MLRPILDCHLFARAVAPRDLLVCQRQAGRTQVPRQISRLHLRRIVYRRYHAQKEAPLGNLDRGAVANVRTLRATLRCASENVQQASTARPWQRIRLDLLRQRFNRAEQPN